MDKDGSHDAEVVAWDPGQAVVAPKVEQVRVALREKGGENVNNKGVGTSSF